MIKYRYKKSTYLAKGALINSCLSANRQECFVKSYSERDLNPHNRYGHKILSLACLPFHHPSRPRAKDETRTRDPNLGKVMLYQLSYFRIICLLDFLNSLV